MNYDALCMGCMQEIGEAENCPYCGFPCDAMQLAPRLALRSMLAGRYMVGKVLCAGGDGVTYLGYDCDRQTKVEIREYLPEQHILRDNDQTQVRVKRGSELLFGDGLRAFLDLFRKLARLRNVHAIVPVLDIFEENGTAYAVLESVETISLRDFLLKSRTGCLSFEQTKVLLMPVLSAVSKLHEMEIIHGGISPTSLRLGRDGKIRITDFMISDARVMGSALEAELTSGYAALEQYSRKRELTAATDVYALGAVAYRMLVGSTPPEAIERVTNDKLLIPAKLIEELPAYAVSAMQNALCIEPGERTCCAEDFHEEFSGSPKLIERTKAAAQEAARAQTTEEEEAERVRKEKMRREILKKEEQTKILVISFAVCLVIGLLILGGYFFMTREPSDGSDTVTTTSSAEQEMVEVPNFKNQSYSRISEDEVLNERFHFVVSYDYSKDVEEGFIISQGTPEGKKLPKGSDLPLTVSKGIEYVTLPDVSGMTYEKATELLVSKGFTCTKAEKVNDGTHTPGVVIGTTPSPNRDYEKGKEVVVQVWGEIATEPQTGINSILPGFFE